MAARNSANYQIAAATLAELQRLSQARLEARPRLLAETGGALHMVDVAQIELVTADHQIDVRVLLDERAVVGECEMRHGDDDGGGWGHGGGGWGHGGGGWGHGGFGGGHGHGHG